MRAFNTRTIWTLFCANLLLTGCGGAKVLKEPKPLPEALAPVAAANDAMLSTQLDWVIVRDGPGTWSRDADWDEYLLRVENLSAETITITAMQVEDSSGHDLGPLGGRKALVKASRATARRYRDEGVTVKAGMGSGTMIATGAAAGAVGASLGAAAVFGSTAAAATGLAAVAAAPVLIVGGVAKLGNAAAVDKEIVRRHSEFPVVLAAGEKQSMHVFFPITPAPRQLVLTYQVDGRETALVIDTAAQLSGLHLATAD